jgi:DNA repair protein RadC
MIRYRREDLIIFEKGKIKSPEGIFKNIKRINIDYKQENYILICLNTNNKVLKSIALFKGGLDACLISPQTIFRTALKYNSAKIIIAHNHPSGNLNPSQEDLEIYNRIKDAGDLLQIKVLDNIIFNKKGFYSTDDK